MAAITRAERNIRWIEKKCRVPEGKFVGQKVKLRPWQKKIVRAIYDNPHGTRTAIISFAKKNAKTTFSAFLLLLHLVGPEAKQNTQLPSTAQSKEQAAVLFKLAAKMVRLNPELYDHIAILESTKQLFCPELGTEYKSLSADAHTAHGQSPIFAVHDELGQVKGPISELYNAIEGAMGAHDEPLSIVISTQAPTDADLLSVLIDDQLKNPDPHTVLVLYAADMEIDPFSVKALRQANPAYGDFLNADELKKLAKKAKRLPAQEPLYRNFNLNQRVQAESPFVTKAIWDQNAGEGVISGSVYAGLDLSETNDLTALTLVSPDNGFLNTETTFWLPGEGLAERSRQDRVPYDVWEKQGFLQITPGKSVEYEYVAQEIARLFQIHDIRKMAFDRFNMKHLKPWLIKAGLSEIFIEDRFVYFGQGFVSMGPALRNLESLLLNGKIRHGAHPILTMCAVNTVVSKDPAGNRKLNKKTSRGRIDGMVTLVMAAAVASEDMYQQPVIPVDVENILEDLHA